MHDSMFMAGEGEGASRIRSQFQRPKILPDGASAGVLDGHLSNVTTRRAPPRHNNTEDTMSTVSFAETPATAWPVLTAMIITLGIALALLTLS